MKIYNTLSHKVEEFVPYEEGKVKMYTCGPTVYSYAHIGNLRTYIFEDILEKSLRYLGYDVLRCMNIIKNHYNINDCFDITITKQIPIGAGMGGGSCDIATIVKYLLKRYNIDENFNQLINLLKDQSADIPYCLTNKVALVEGIGEKVSEVFVKVPDEFIIVNPRIYISTKRNLKKVKNYSKPFTKDILVKQIATKGYNAFSNDLEETAFLLYPQLQEIKKNLTKIGHTVMSGSGSTMMVFGDDITNMIEQIKNMYPQYFIRKVRIIKEKNNGN